MVSRIPLLIGKLTPKIKVFPVKSPFPTAEILHDLECIDPTSSSSVVPEICQAADKGFREWSDKSPNERAEIFENAMKILSERKSEFVQGHLDVGGPNWFADFNVNGAIKQTKQYASCILSQVEGVIPQTSATSLALTVRTPIGPVLSIAPWNAPVILSSRAILAPLAAGCSVVLKSSEKAPLLSYLLVKCFHDAGVPESTLQLVNVAPEDAPQLTEQFLSDKHIRMVNFTGSTEVGSQIASVAGKYLKPHLLELGGKNCSIVEPDADLEKCCSTILRNAWWHQGQICMAMDKVYVHNDIYETFKKKLLQMAQTEAESNADYKIPQRDNVVAGKVTDLIQDALSKGATVLFKPAETETPLILEGVTSGMRVDTEESFGPLFSLYRYGNLRDAIEAVNSSDMGLKASIWSSNVVKAIATAKKIQCGGVHINSSTIHDESTIPHGGVKGSGQGRFNGSWGIESFSYPKAITID